MNGLLIRSAFYSIMFAVLTFVSGCGGGTTGTEDFGKARILGLLTDQTGQPLSNITVTAGESGNSDITTAEGNFELLEELPLSSFELFLDGGSISSSVEIGLPAETGADDTVLVSLEVNTSDSSIRVTSIRLVIPETEASQLRGEVEQSALSRPLPENTPGPLPTKRPDIKPTPATASQADIQGTLVLRNGTPVHGARIQVGNRRAVTDANGNFQLSILDYPPTLTISVVYRTYQSQVQIRGLPSLPHIIVELQLLLQADSLDGLKGRPGGTNTTHTGFGNPRPFNPVAISVEGLSVTSR